MKHYTFLIVSLLMLTACVFSLQAAEKLEPKGNDEHIEIGGVFPKDIISGTIYIPEGWYIFPFRNADGHLTGDGVIARLGFPDFIQKEIRNQKEISDDYAHIYYRIGSHEINREQFKGKDKKIGNMHASTVYVYPREESEAGNLFLYPLHETYFRSNIPVESELTTQLATEIAMIVFSFKAK